MASPACARFLALCMGLVAASENPFEGKSFYVNPQSSDLFAGTLKAATGSEAANLKAMRDSPTAIWLNAKSQLKGDGPGTLRGILKQAAVKSEFVVFVLYNLPNRNCNANVSFGEICCKAAEDGACNWEEAEECRNGINEYETAFIDPIVKALQEYDGKVPSAVVVEPDSLATLATNPESPRCNNTATRSAYSVGVRYAVSQLAAKAPSTAIYLDAAHGGVLGWEENLNSYMSMLGDIKLPFSKVRGFSTNVGGYNAVGTQCPWCPEGPAKNNFCLQGRHPHHECCADPCGLLKQYNFANNELNYAAALVTAAKNWLHLDAHVVIDTSRNGVADARKSCSNWCNPSGAGAGSRPTAKTANASLVDAYFWIKTPGLSDGCDAKLGDDPDPKCDANCFAKGAKSNAPQAGKWFEAQAKELAANANFDVTAAAPALDDCPVEPPPGQEDAYSYISADGDEQCGGPYKQCGGDYWHGPSCCGGKCKCEEQKHKNWSSWMCKPPKGEWKCGHQKPFSDQRLYSDAAPVGSVVPARQESMALPAVLAVLGTCGCLAVVQRLRMKAAGREYSELRGRHGETSA
mmetsp:Transcript_21230/g.49410  ORF Transcript_21230/g.49410 Transcript_21230/m.49410 type:complete len:576 (+) Transcript_21230:54-1781(+)